MAVDVDRRDGAARCRHRRRANKILQALDAGMGIAELRILAEANLKNGDTRIIKRGAQNFVRKRSSAQTC